MAWKRLGWAFWGGRGSADLLALCTLHSEAAMVAVELEASRSISKHLEASRSHRRSWRMFPLDPVDGGLSSDRQLHSSDTYPFLSDRETSWHFSFIIIYHHLSSFVTWCTCFHLYLFWFQSLSKELEKSLRSLRYFKLVHPTTHQWIQSLRPLQQGWHYDIGHRVCVTGLGQKANKRQLQARNMEYIWVHLSTWTLGILGCSTTSAIAHFASTISLSRVMSPMERSV